MLAVESGQVRFEGFSPPVASNRRGHTIGSGRMAARDDLKNGRGDPDLEKHAATAVILWGVLLVVVALLL